MTVVVTGGGGQLGRALGRWGAAQGREVIALDRGALDVRDAAAVAAGLARYSPTLVINAAAYTAVDRAETNAAVAFAVNADGAAVVARACAARGVTLVHVSTDHVFDGRADRPYVEDDAVAPVNVYGASKAAGERAVRDAGGTVVRTSWLFAPDGWGFVPAIVRAALAGTPLRVVADQHSRPTPVDDLAAALVGFGAAPPAIYHCAGAGAASRYELACAIVDELGLAGPVTPITTADGPTVAARPRCTVLDTARAEALGLGLPSWRPGLARAVAALARRG